MEVPPISLLAVIEYVVVLSSYFAVPEITPVIGSKESPRGSAGVI